MVTAQQIRMRTEMEKNRAIMKESPDERRKMFAALFAAI